MISMGFFHGIFKTSYGHLLVITSYNWLLLWDEKLVIAIFYQWEFQDPKMEVR
jgi:hypothetical protein